MGLDKLYDFVVGGIYDKGVDLKNWTTEHAKKKTVTSLDRRTVRDLNNAIDLLKNKLKNKRLSATDQKAIEKEITRLDNQRIKTLNLFGKYKNKHSKLKGLTPNVLSVKKIYDLSDIKTIEGNSKADKFGGWLFDSKENLVGLIGGGVALTAFLHTETGMGMLSGLNTAIFGPEGLAFLIATNPAAAIAIGGSGVLAGAIIYKQIKKKRMANEAARQEAEVEMNKGTAYDVEQISESITNNDIFKNLVAEAASDDSVMEHLMEFSMNPSNKSTDITQANKIISAAQAQRNANEVQAQQATFIANIRSNQLLYNMFSTYAAYEDIQKLYEKATETKETETNPASTKIFDETSVAEIVDLKIAYEDMQSGNLEAINKKIGSKGAVEFVESIIGPSGKPTAGINTTKYSNYKTELTQIYNLAKAKNKNLEIKNAEIELKKRKTSGEFTITETPGKNPILTIDGYAFDLKDKTKDLGGLAAYHIVIEEACKYTGFIDEDDKTTKGSTLAVKYAKIINASKDAILSEREAARTGVVKGM